MLANWTCFLFLRLVSIRANNNLDSNSELRSIQSTLLHYTKCSWKYCLHDHVQSQNINTVVELPISARKTIWVVFVFVFSPQVILLCTTETFHHLLSLHKHEANSFFLSWPTEELIFSAALIQLRSEFILGATHSASLFQYLWASLFLHLQFSQNISLRF